MWVSNTLTPLHTVVYSTFYWPVSLQLSLSAERKRVSPLILNRTLQPKSGQLGAVSRESVGATDPGVRTRRSSVLLGECDRRGFTELFTAEGRSIILPTTCKTWGCVVCRKKLIALFKARVEHGVSILGDCVFMTITYQADTERLADARCVAKDWAALWRQLRRLGNRWSWLKVTELTKRRIPHHHVVIGRVTGEVRCHGKRVRRGAETTRYLNRMAICMCVAHKFAREWVKITGDSFMCFATPVDSGLRAGSYMAKYMHKTFEGPFEGRRFSTSRDWPGGQRIRLKITEEKGWSHIRQWPQSHFPSNDNLNAREGDLLLRVGDDITKAIALRNYNKAAQREFRRILGNDDSVKR